MSNSILITYKNENIVVFKETVSLKLEVVKTMLERIRDKENCSSTIYKPDFEGFSWNSVDITEFDSKGVVVFFEKDWITANNFSKTLVNKSDSLTITDLQKHVEDFSREKGFENTSLEQRTMYLMSEIGELSKSLLKEDKTDIGLEMFDVVWNLVDLANKLNIDLDQSFKAKMEINKDRVWEKKE